MSVRQTPTKRLRFALSACGVQPDSVRFALSGHGELLLQCKYGDEDRVNHALSLCCDTPRWRELTFAQRFPNTLAFLTEDQRGRAVEENKETKP